MLIIQLNWIAIKLWNSSFQRKCALSFCCPHGDWLLVLWQVAKQFRNLGTLCTLVYMRVFWRLCGAPYAARPPRPSRGVGADHPRAGMVLSMLRQAGKGLINRGWARTSGNLFWATICRRFQDQNLTCHLWSGTQMTSHMSRGHLQAPESSVSSTNSFRKVSKRCHQIMAFLP